MGIRLDWEIESESKQVKSAGEDPLTKKQRRAARMRLLLTVFVLLIVMGCAVGALAWRWHQVNASLEQSLRDTVAAEVTALRLGDRIQFSRFQRSDDTDWLNEQKQLFDEYQRLIIRDDLDIQLTGHVLEVEIDDPRARVHVQEIIAGVPYIRVWFYWRYEDDADNDDFVDGWRHVPPDTEFWGKTDTLTSEFVTINYREVDVELASQMANHIDQWMIGFCRATTCTGIPMIFVDILPDGVEQISWTGTELWRIAVPSPYLNRARGDNPFSPEMQIEVATLLAERLIIYVTNGRETDHLTDAYFIQQAITSWFIGQFAQINTHSYLISSFAENYDLGQLLAAMTSDSNISLLAQVTGTPLDKMLVDWRDFFEWRLKLENELILSGNTDAILGLYDTRDEGVRTAAYSRVNQVLPEPIVVTLTRPHELSADGLPQRVITVVVGENPSFEMEILFRLVNGNWLRAS